MPRCLPISMFCGLLVVAAWAPSDAQVVTEQNTTFRSLRAKARPDECFSGVGQNQPFSAPPCLGAYAKVNQGYVWAMTAAGDDVWFGTVANPQCLTEGGFAPDPPAYAAIYWACEFGQGPYSPWPLPGSVGDFRPPRIFVYTKATHVLQDLTPTLPVTPDNPIGVHPLIATTLGIRAAATVGNLVLLGGPNLLGGINFFAFRADTREFLGAQTLPGYTNVRQFTLVAGDQLYTAVGAGDAGGTVLRWRGFLTAAPCASCFQFEVVGRLDGAGAYIAAHNGRLFVTTWPSGQQNVLAGLYRSPVLPRDGLGAVHAGLWEKVWDVAEYEPDPLVAATYGGGAIASFDGYLYWGTMHVPWLALAVFVGTHGLPIDPQGWAGAVEGTLRTAALFRGRTFDGKAEISLLYGAPQLPVYQPASGSAPGTWQLTDNAMPIGQKLPLFGSSGLGNRYNNYIWSMAVWDKRLWVGTMDWGLPARVGLFSRALTWLGGGHVPEPVVTQKYGADLFFFQTSDTPAVPENVTGLGNYTSYGIRNMLPSTSLFVGMANPNNLQTGLLPPSGGWELVELQALPSRPPLPLLKAFSCTAVSGRPSVRCTVELSDSRTSTTVRIGDFFGYAPGARLPALALVPVGNTTKTFEIPVNSGIDPTRLLLVAELNGGTRVAKVQAAP